MELFERNIHKNIIPGMFSIYKHMASENIYEGQWLAIMIVKVIRLKPNFPILLQRFDFVPNFGCLLQWRSPDTIYDNTNSHMPSRMCKDGTGLKLVKYETCSIAITDKKTKFPKN